MNGDLAPHGEAGPIQYADILRPLGSLGTATVALAAVFIVGVVANGLLQYMLGGPGLVIGTIQFVIMLSNIAVYVVAALWFYRAAENARGLAEGEPKWAPGWAWGVWLIPFANFALGYLFTRELWQRSDPHAADPDSSRLPGWFHLWWVAWAGYWLISLAFSVYSAVQGFTVALTAGPDAAGDPTQVVPLSTAVGYAVVTGVILITAWILFHRLVRVIEANQQQKAARIVQGGGWQQAPAHHGTL